MSNALLDTYRDALSMLDDDNAPTARLAAPVEMTAAQKAYAEEKAQLEHQLEHRRRAALPDDLCVLAIEFDLMRNGRRLTEDDLSEMEYANWMDYSEAISDIVGSLAFANPGQKTVFGKGDSYRTRLDMIVSRDLLERRLRRPHGGYGLGLQFGWDGEDPWWFRLAEKPGKVLPSFAHASALAQKEDDAEYQGSVLTAKRISTWNYRNSETIADGFAQWVRAAQTTDADLDRLFALAEACASEYCDGDLSAMREALERNRAKPDPVTFLVPGLIPRGVVTLLLGDKKTGKSAIAMELAVAIARKESHWLGFPLARCKGHAVYLLGEDAPAEAARRIQSMTDGELPDLLCIIPADGTELDGLLNKLKKHKVDLLVVDPARKYHTGNEDDSTEISNMLNKLQAFAAAKTCAVIVLHHLKRGAVIKNINDLGTSYRGSGVYTDRARVTLGLRRNGNETEIGIPAPGGTPLHNLLASEMFTGKRRLRRDEATFRHIPLGMTNAAAGSKGTPIAADVSAETAAAVERAAVALLQSGERVTKTGKAALFERKMPALTGLTRAVTRAAVDSLVADGRLCCDVAGALSLPVAASAPTLEDMI